MTSSASQVHHRTLRILATVLAIRWGSDLVEFLYAWSSRFWLGDLEPVRQLHDSQDGSMILLGLGWKTVLLLLATWVAAAKQWTKSVRVVAWILALLPLCSLVSVIAVAYHFGIPETPTARMLGFSTGQTLVGQLFFLVLSGWMIHCLLHLRRSSPIEPAD